jgi:DNA repair ATPase RecN
MIYLLFKPKWATEIVDRLRELKHMMRQMMAQVDDLTTVLTAVSGELDALGTDVDQLIQKVTDLQNSTPPEVDLTDVINMANGIKSRLDSVSTKAADATPDTPPAGTGDGA